MKNQAKSKQVICILGGMGPQASARLVATLVDKFADQKANFPEIILDSVPVPEFISGVRNKVIALKILKDRVKKLEPFSPTDFAIACNTAHLFLPDLQKGTNTKFISLIEEVSMIVLDSKIRKIGLLATPTTINSGLYRGELEKCDIEIVLPNSRDIKRVEEVIRRVIAGKSLGSDGDILVNIAQKLKTKGAGGIILGCTELPFIFPKNFDMPVFDSIEILANAILKRGEGKNNL